MQLFSTYCAICTLLVLSTSAFLHKPPPKDCIEQDVDVAIIGGGSAGTYAAIQLKSTGSKIALIEKKSQIGGHAETYYDPSTKAPTNIGVIVFEDSDLVKRYFAQLGVPAVTANFSSLGRKSKSYDFKLGIPIPELGADAMARQQRAVEDALEAYSTNVLPKYPWIDQGYFVPEPVPAELTMPFGQFAQQNNFSALLPIMSQLNWYPGNISTLPTLYGIKNFGPGLLKSFTGNFLMSGTGDTRSLYYAAAEQLGEDVLLNVSVVHIDRQKGTKEYKNSYAVSLVVNQPGQKPRKIRARKLFLAIPPTLDNLEFLDVTEQEHGLFSKFSALGYFAGIALIPGLDVNLQNVGAFTPFHTPLIPGSNGYNAANTPNGFTLGVAFDNASYSDADAEAIVRKELATLAGVGALPAAAARSVTFPYVSNHVPFNVRVSAEDIASGFYKDLLGLEGQHDTYWAGAAFSGHNSALIWTWVNGTVLPALRKELSF